MTYNPTPQQVMSPEATPSCPERRIHPLPKRRLRERLSPDVVELIKYPLAPRAKPPLFYQPYTLRDENVAGSLTESLNSSEGKRVDEYERNYVFRRSCEEPTGEREANTYRDLIFARQSIDFKAGSYNGLPKLDSKYNSQLSGSVASSVDGYDSFENTNNNKKRKIPTPGESSLSGVRFSGEITGASTTDDVENLINHSPSSLQGISGPGRGRYGRNRNGRSPLRILSDPLSNWSNLRTSKQRQPQWSSPPKAEGIISRSIANANAEKNHVTPARGQENSTIQYQASKRSSPSSTQFTFSCDKQVPGWPGPSTSLIMHQNSLSTRMSTHATQTSPNMPSNRGMAYTKEMHMPQSYSSNGLKQNQDQTALLKKTRNRTGKNYLIAARQRRYQQAYRNYHHPVASEDIWICEFCEYERIFGTPPEALIRQYEIKDRRARKQEAERRRLLEKAKMKGRKSKRGNKSANKSTLSHDRLSRIQASNNNNLPADGAQNQPKSFIYNNQNDDYFKDDYDDTAQFSKDSTPKSHVPPLGTSIINDSSSGSAERLGSCNDAIKERFITDS